MEKTGFLVLHACKNNADAQCSQCGKYICSKHTHIRASAPVCESCFRKLAPEEYQKSLGPDRFYYGYTPFAYSRYHDIDYKTFDRNADVFHEDSTGT